MKNWIYKQLLWASVALPPAAAWNTACAAETDSSSQVIGEIIVTAQKRSETIQEVPASITAISGDALQDRGISTPQDLQFMVPSMQAGRLLGQTSITIRGIGLNQGAPGVAIHVDGVYQPQAAMGDLMQTDIERVEVLRGPQGTLYGRNANGGVINFVTKAPGSELEGYVLGSYASYDETRLQGVINAPISDRVRARLVVDDWRRQDGFVENVLANGQDVDKGETLSGRLRVSADLLDTLSLDLSATSLHSTGPTYYTTLYNAPSAAAVASNPYLASAIVPLEPRRTSANDPIDMERDYSAVSATVNWQLGSVNLRSISGYQRLTDRRVGDGDSINVSAFPLAAYARSETFTQELNLSAEMGSFDTVFGAFYMHDNREDRVDFDFVLGIAPLPPGSRSSFDSPRYLTDSYGVFADATWSLSERARVIAGLRYSKDELSLTQQDELSFGPAITLPTCSLQTNEVTFDSTTPRVGVQFDVSDNSNLYATYSEGFKAGGFNLYACNNQFRPEEVTSYEVGWKNQLLDRRLTLNAAAFYYDYTNLQLLQLVGFLAQVTNAASAEVKGLELEGIWQPEGHWSMNANLSLLSAKFTDFVNIDSLEPALGPQNLEGNYLADAPEFSSNVGLAYQSDPVLAGGRITLRADASYRSRVYFREFNTRLDAQDPYTIVNASLIWDSAAENYRVRLFANNLFDEDYIVRMVSSDSLGSRSVAWGAPEQFGLELKVSF